MRTHYHIPLDLLRWKISLMAAGKFPNSMASGNIMALNGWFYSKPWLITRGYPEIWSPEIFGGVLFFKRWMATKWCNLPSGNLTVCYWKWPFIVDLPTKNCDFLQQTVSLPEGKLWYPMESNWFGYDFIVEKCNGDFIRIQKGCSSHGLCIFRSSKNGE